MGATIYAHSPDYSRGLLASGASVQRVPTRREIDAYIEGFEGVTIELRGYGLSEREREELIRDAIEELSASRTCRISPRVEDRYEHDVDELMA